MITFVVTIQQAKGGVRMRIRTPASDATMAEADFGHEFMKTVEKFAETSKAVVERPWSGANDPARQ